MKLSQIIVASVVAYGNGFILVNPTKSSTALGSFLDGKAARIDVREKEDAAMWIDEPPKKAAPAAKKAAPAAKKAAPVAKKGKEPPKAEAPKKSGFKFPWDK